MRRLISVLLILSLILCFTGCTSGKEAGVPKPMDYYPDYTFEEIPSQRILRETACQAMKDILSIQWCTDTSYKYHKTGPVSNKEYIFEPGNIYAGIPYNNANAGIFQFLEYYDHETGTLEYPRSAEELKNEIGVDCASAVLWAWSTVCTSIVGGYYPNYMVIKNGYIPVGTYKYDANTPSFAHLPTQKIIRMNGQKIMFESYKMIEKADAVVSSTDNHAMMAVEDAHIEYLPNGQLDRENSYVIFMDQRAGGEKLEQTDENGNVLHFSGRLEAKFTFNELYRKHYIPVSALEFQVPYYYEHVEAEVNQECNSYEDLKTAVITSNYPFAVLRISAVRGGKETVLHREMFSGTSLVSVTKSMCLGDLDVIKNLKDTKYSKAGTRIKVDMVSSNGVEFQLIDCRI